MKYKTLIVQALAVLVLGTSFSSCSSTPERAPGIDAQVKQQAMKQPLMRSASAKQSGINLKCVVNLPGDVTSTNEDLCPNFPMFATDAQGNVIARFKFNQQGIYRLPVKKDTVVFLHAEATDEWRVDFDPTGRYVAGMSVKLLFIRRP